MFGKRKLTEKEMETELEQLESIASNLKKRKMLEDKIQLKRAEVRSYSAGEQRRQKLKKIVSNVGKKLGDVANKVDKYGTKERQQRLDDGMRRFFS